ncbi:MAG: hypothetical protein WCP31_05355, partial [Chloroflexales bacterium]
SNSERRLFASATFIVSMRVSLVIECLPLGAETQQIERWEERHALARFSVRLHGRAIYGRHTL